MCKCMMKKYCLLRQIFCQYMCNFHKNNPFCMSQQKGFVCHNKINVCHSCNEKLLQRNGKLLFPVVPDVLDIVKKLEIPNILG